MNAAPTEWCNNFWGAGEPGYDVVIRRIKDTGQTLDDLRAFYKERADIEAEYAQRLAKLARRPIGQNETGQIAAALKTLRYETERTAQTHATLATDLNGPISEGVVQFQQLQTPFRSTGLLAIDKIAKAKANQAAMVDGARDKYQTACTKVNMYSAQLNVVSGRDYERTLAQMDQAKSDVMTHERDYKLNSKALKETMYNWTKEWKGFCDQAQDLDEARIEFVVQNTWRYIDALAEACVEDDGACQNVYDALKVVNPCDPTFVQERGTGNQVYDPPDGPNFASGQPATQPHFRVAKFARVSQRPQRPLQTDSEDSRPTPQDGQGQTSGEQLAHSSTVPQQKQAPYPAGQPDPNFESSPARDDRAHLTSTSPAAAPTPLQVANSPAQAPSSPRSVAGRNPVEDRLAAAMRGVQVSKGSPATSPTQPEYVPPATQSSVQPSYGSPPSHAYAGPPTQPLHLSPQLPHDQPAQAPVHTQSSTLQQQAQPVQYAQPASQPSPAVQYVQDYHRQSRIPSSYALAPTTVPAPTPHGGPSPCVPASTPNSAIPPDAATQYLHAQRDETSTPYASATASPAAAEPSTAHSYTPQVPAPSYVPPYAPPTNVAPQQQHLVQGPAPVQPPQTYSSAPTSAPVPSDSSPGAAAAAAPTEPSSLTGKLTEEGRPVQFFVKALYAYSADQDGEFSFEEGDIIAVTEYPPDGWWKGELLDEARRRPGQNTFPSNFVQLLV